jgi:putative ATPase
MKNLGYGEGYQYDPDTETGFSGADYFPEGMERPKLYRPTRNGYEQVIGDKIAEWEAIRARRNRDS